MSDRPAFVTGSHIYGTPTGDSDVDVVMLVEPETAGVLGELIEGIPANDVYADAVREGLLNLILCTTKAKYDAWQRARDRCIKERPVARDRAVAIHKEEGVK